MPNIGPMELVLLGIVAVLLFGAKRMPEIGRSVGKGLRDFRQAVGGGTDVGEIVGAVAEVRNAASPTNLAVAFVPGVRDVQETVGAAKSAVSTDAAAAGPESGEASAVPSDEAS